MRNHLRWLFLFLFGIALIGCQDDLNVNSPVNNHGGSGFTLNKGVVETLTKDLTVTGSGILAAGTGCQPNGVGTIQLTVPSGYTINNVFLYWESRNTSANPNGDDQISIQGNSVSGTLIGKAAVPEEYMAFSYRAEITGLNLISADGLTKDYAIDNFDAVANVDIPNGAGIIVVYSDGTKTSSIDIRDGADFAYIERTNPQLRDTEKQSFTFLPVSFAREAYIYLFAGDVGKIDGTLRPNYLKYWIGGIEYQINNPLFQADGEQWDTYKLPLTIPPDVSQVEIQLFSGPSGGLLPSSFVWVAAGFSIPIPDQLGRLGNFVWEDINKNGIQDQGEPGIPGAYVGLFDCNFERVPGYPIIQTDNNGYYLFDNLPAGQYRVKFEALTGYTFTTPNMGADDKIDSDVSVDIGINTDGKEDGFTECITLGAGQEDLTWDAGIYLKSITQLNKIGDFVWHDKNVNGIQDTGEPGIAGVKVELLSGSTVINSTTTDANGKYEFNDLANGNYCVRVAASNYESGGVFFNTAQTKWYATKKNQGFNDAKDSDALKNESVCVDLNNNDDLTLDFGFYKTCVSITKLADKQTAKPGEYIKYTFIVENCGDITLSGGVDLYDKMLNPTAPHKIANITPVYPGTSKSITKTYCVKSNDCGDLVNTVKAVGHPIDGSANVEFSASVTVKIDCTKPAKLGDRVWLDKDNDGIQDYGENGIKNVVVKLYDCNGNYIKSTITNYYGKYYFSNLTPGDYKVKFVAPTGYVFTKQDQGSNDEKDSDADPATGFTKCITLGSGVTDLKWDAGLYKSSTVCTYTLGYWKTHSKYGPAKPRNSTWDLVGSKKEDTDFFKSGKTWYKVFWTSPSGNVYYNLAHQYMAAKLNVLAGAYAPIDVASAITEAETLFNTYAPNQVKYLSSSKKEKFLKLAELLEKYNEGKIGPGHCD